jgi:hypothetical protein
MPHEETPTTLAIELPFGTWLGVEAALKNQRYEMQRWVERKTEQSAHVRLAELHAIEEITRAIDKISDRTSSV